MFAAVVRRRPPGFTMRSTYFWSPRPILALTAHHRQTHSAPVPQPPASVLKAEIEDCYSKLDTSFEDTQKAFKSKSNSDLIRALVVLGLCRSDFLVKHNQQLLATLRRLVGKALFTRILKSTFYGHFVAGEDQKEIVPTVDRLRRFGVKSILDYSAEADLSQEEAKNKSDEGRPKDHLVAPAITETGVIDSKTVEATRDRYSVHSEFGDRREKATARTYFYEGEQQCDANMAIFKECIDAVADATRSQGFAAIKITALGRPQLLLKLSECIVQTSNFFSALTGSSGRQVAESTISRDELLDKLKQLGVRVEDQAVKEWFDKVDRDADGKLDFFEFSRLLDRPSGIGSLFQVLNVKTGKLESLLQNLTKDEEQELANMISRTVEVADYAVGKGVRLMVDAEQTYFQPAISRLAIALSRKYNRERGNIFNTYQAYLRATYAEMEKDMQLAAREGWHFGAKLVRGAYMDQERKRAATIGYDDPVNPDYEATSTMYERCLTRIADEYGRRGHGNVSVMAASHNEETVRFAVELMRARGIAPSQRVICFAQLYGMCDQVSFMLGQAGYSVYKYLPYGPVDEVLPYLSRRALENGGLLKKVAKERRLIGTELRRRLLSGQIVYRP